MGADLYLRILLEARDNASKAVKALGGNLAGLSKSQPIFNALGIGLLAVGAGVAFVGYQSVKMAMEYQTAMTQLQNTTGSSDAQMRQYTATIRQLSDTTGVAQTDLAQGMYQIISANFAGADATRILATATKAALIAGADQTKVTTGLVVSLNAFKMKADQVDIVSNQMFKTLSLGRGQMGDLTGALQTGAALVHHYGVSMTDMDATLATLSTGGMKTFGTSMTGLTQLLNAMDGKTDMIAKRMHKLGIAFDEPYFKTLSYTQQVAYLNKALENNKGQTVAILGSKQAAVALSILGTQSGLLTNNIKKLSDAQELAKEKAAAWAKKQQDTALQLKKLQTNVNNLLTDLGSQLLPVINDLIARIGPLVTRFGDWLIKSGALKNGINFLVGSITNVVHWIAQFAAFLQHNQGAMETFKVVLVILAGVIGGIMVAALVSMAIWAWAAVAPLLPFIAIGALVALVIYGIVLAVQHWGEIAHWLQGVWNNILTWLKGLWDKIVNIVKIGALLILAAIFAPFLAIAALFIWLYNHNVYFKKLVDTIRMWVSAGITWLKGAWQNTVKFLAGLWGNIVTGVSSMWGKISGFFQNAWSTYISTPLHNLWKMVVDFANGWPKQALQWGINFIQGLINGIWSMAGKVGDTAKNIAGKIAGFLGFHSPAKEGPGRELDTWGQNMINGYVASMLKARPVLQSALYMMVAPIASTLSTPPRPASSSGGGTAGGGGNLYLTIEHIHVNDFGPNMPNSVANAIVDKVDQKLAMRYKLQTSSAQTGVS